MQRRLHKAKPATRDLKKILLMNWRKTKPKIRMTKNDSGVLYNNTHMLFFVKTVVLNMNLNYIGLKDIEPAEHLYFYCGLQIVMVNN